MTDREVWITAGKLFAEFERDPTNDVVERIISLTDGMCSIDDWRRVAVAVATMESAGKQ